MNDERATSDGMVLIDEVADWLVTQAISEADLKTIFNGLCIRLHAAGIPLSRGHVAFNTLHPLFRSISMTWTPLEGIIVTEYPHRDGPAEDWERSPFYHLIIHNVEHIRRRLRGADAVLDFPILTEFKQRGGSDYLAFMVNYDQDVQVEQGYYGDGIIGSWLTNRESGFNELDLRALRRVQLRLAVACKIEKNAQIVENVLHAYLGRGPGSQVLNGQIKRGDMQSIHAVIWYSDLRDSTKFAEQMPGRQFLDALNKYFECTAGVVMQHGGEVLRFVGDAVLAIFQIDEQNNEQQAAAKALKATKAAQCALDDMNKSDPEMPSLAFGLGLHIGEVLFGNIGVPERLEFSVIGPAANEVARLESLTKTLGHKVLASSEFAKHCEQTWESLGFHALKGVNESREVFGLKFYQCD